MTLRLDFTQLVEALGTDPHKTLQPMLHALGFSDERLEIVNPKTSKQSHAVIINGELLPGRMMEMFRKFEATSVSHDYGTAEPMPEVTDPKQLTIVASKKHLAAVKSLLDELKSTMRRDTVAEMSNKYASKIDALPILNVDPDLLTFSANVSGSLRYQAQAKLEAGIRSGVRNSIPVYETRTFGAGVYGGYGVPYNGAYGTYTSYRRVLPDTAGIATQEQAPATQVRISEWRQIEEGLGKIRRTLTERYMTEF